VVRHRGKGRAAYLLKRLADHATDTGVKLPPAITTPYRNTIPPEAEKRMPGDLFVDRRIRSLIRWNALAMVMRANDDDEGLGGHIATFLSSATLYDVGFNYFFRASQPGKPGDIVMYQGHSAPGMYARSYLEGRLGEEQLDNFRREVDGRGL
jgi:pyruvate dehydrogenase E1 component